jgi:hypothetical protein
MRIQDITESKSKPRSAGDITPHDYNPGWEKLNWIKSRGLERGKKLRYQLFVPRPHPNQKPVRDRRLANLSNKYAWDDDGNLKKPYANWEDPGHRDISGTGMDVQETAPILKPGRATSPPGNNKPAADLWTSSAIKQEDGWSSDWSQWVERNQPSWFNDVGYLYRVKPGTIILDLDSEYDASDIYDAFDQLGRATPIDYSDQWGRLTRHFPWDQIALHFDGVYHSGYGSDNFTYGWDVESTAWLNTNMLELVGKVPVASVGWDNNYR